MKRRDLRCLLTLLSMAVAAVVLAGVLAGCEGSDTPSFYPAGVAGFGGDRFLATSYSKDWSEHQDELADGVNLVSDRLYCLDASATVRWSLILGGWAPGQMDACPTVYRAVMTARPLEHSGSGPRTERILLVDQDSDGRGATVTLLREISVGENESVEVAIARDGASVAVLTSAAGDASADATGSLEVIDIYGTTIREFAIPGRWFCSGWSIDGDLESAGLTLVRYEDGGGQAFQTLLFRADGTHTLASDQDQHVALSVDGCEVALTVSRPGIEALPGDALLTMYAWEDNLGEVWAIDVPGPGAEFNEDGSMVLSSWAFTTTDAQGKAVSSENRVEVLSASDGSTLWQLRDDSTEPPVSRWLDAQTLMVIKGHGDAEAEPGTTTLVDFSGVLPVETELSLKVAPLCLSYDGRTGLGLDAGGKLVPLTLR